MDIASLCRFYDLLLIIGPAGFQLAEPTARREGRSYASGSARDSAMKMEYDGLRPVGALYLGTVNVEPSNIGTKEGLQANRRTFCAVRPPGFLPS